MSQGRDERTEAILGAAFAVHGELGPGFLEPVYQEAMALELESRAVPFEREVNLAVRYRGALLRTAYKADFVCYGEVLVELKALTRLGKVEQSQVLNYLKATGFKTALLLNFGAASLEIKRLVGPPAGPRTSAGDESHESILVLAPDNRCESVKSVDTPSFARVEK